MDKLEQRFYSSGFGRFMSADGSHLNIGLDNSGSWNKYSYVNGDPINGDDPRGLDCQLTADGSGAFVLSCSYSSGNGSGSSGSKAGGNLPNDPPKVPCIQPPHPGLADNQIQKMIDQAQSVISNALENGPRYYDPAGVNVVGTTVTVALLGFLNQQFQMGGPWDFKDAPAVPVGSGLQAQLQNYGNFAFGAVLEGLGFNYYFTQNAAGVNQVKLCLSGYACGTGPRFFQYPYGDQVSDAKFISSGYDYEQNVQSGNCLKQP